jgi:hypothetical protein
MDVALAILKFTAVLSAGVWGVVGLLVDYKKDGEITRWGRRALFGTVASTLIAVLTQSIETYKDRVAAHEAERKRSAEAETVRITLEQINRAISPFRENVTLSVVYWVRDSPAVRLYFARLLDQAAGKPLLYLRRHLMPNGDSDKELPAAGALNAARLGAWFVQGAALPTTEAELQKIIAAPDLELVNLDVGDAFRRPDSVETSAENVIDCAIKSGKPCALAIFETAGPGIRVEARNLSPVFRTNSGKLKSLPDFGDTLLLVQLSGLAVGDFSASVESVTLRTPEGRELIISGLRPLPFKPAFIGYAGIFAARVPKGTQWN